MMKNANTEEKYRSYKEFVNIFNLKKGDTVFISSDILRLMILCERNNDKFDINLFIENFQNKVGDEGTVIFPTYNWDFCKGVLFDYYKTACKTGSLGSYALKRDDFIRTKHPIYSFAVWGKDKDLLYNMDNTASFGKDSPFNYFYEKNVKNIIIDIDLTNSFTFVHYVEQYVGNLCYRYNKNFIGQYTDKFKNNSSKMFSMFVRDLDLNVIVDFSDLEKELLELNIMLEYSFNGIKCYLLEMNKSFEVIKNDILFNKSKKLVTYIGQEVTK